MPPAVLESQRPSRRRSSWSDVFAIDVRSLAALRIVLALTVLADLAMRAPNLRVHYSDDGILPRQALLTHLDPWLLSLALSNGSPLFQGLLFAVTAAAAVALLLGYRTRLATFVVWLLVLSIQWRNPYVGSSADGLLRMLLFWAMFVPLGATWSLDQQRMHTLQSPPTRVLSLGTAGLLLQIAFMYWFTVALKSGPAWRVDGTALYYALSIQELATPLGSWLLQFPVMLKGLTFLTLGIEIGAPLLLFSPVWPVPLRMVAIAAIVALHTGIWLTLTLGIFPWLSAACMVVFLPSWFWDTLLSRSRGWRVIGQPMATALQVMERLMSMAASSTTWLGWGNGPNRIALAAGDGPLAHGDQPHPAASLSAHPDRPPASERRAEPPTTSVPVLVNLVAAFCLLYVFVWNLTAVSAVNLTDEARNLGAFLGLVQSWNMFAPYPYDSTSWYSLPGTLRDGRHVELLPFLYHDEPNRLTAVSTEKPQDVHGAFAYDEHWRKYFESLHDDANAFLLPPLAQYLCREWNTTNAGTPSELESVQIIYNRERTLPDNQRAPVQQLVQANDSCFGAPAAP